MTVKCLTWLLVMYFAPSPKHIIRLSARFENSDSTWKLLFGDPPPSFSMNMCVSPLPWCFLSLVYAAPVTSQSRDSCLMPAAPENLQMHTHNSTAEWQKMDDKMQVFSVIDEYWVWADMYVTWVWTLAGQFIRQTQSGTCWGCEPWSLIFLQLSFQLI